MRVGQKSGPHEGSDLGNDVWISGDLPIGYVSFETTLQDSFGVDHRVRILMNVDLP